MRKPVLLIAMLATPMLLTGCIYALSTNNEPSQQKLQIVHHSPARYSLRVADEESYQVQEDGRVVFDVPRLGQSCSIHLCCGLKLKDGHPENRKAIQILRDGNIVRTLSLNQLAKLPTDDSGYHLLPRSP